MTVIELYQPKKINLKVNFPTEWNELQLPDLHAIAKTILGEQLANEATAFLFTCFLQHRVKKYKSLTQLLDAEDVAINGLPLLDFIFTDNRLTKQPYPKIWMGFKKLLGPADDFNNLTCGEFEDAEFFYYQFKEDPNPESLANLAAILYRPKKQQYFFKNKQGVYTTYDITCPAKFFNSWQPWQLFTIFLWYCGCREMLPRYFPTMYGSSGGNAAPDMAVFTKCIHSGAGPKNGTRNDIRQMPLKEFYMDMEEEAKKAEELKAEMEKLKRK